ncbi:MAG: recombinase family protein [Chloroflexota bacterium]
MRAFIYCRVSTEEQASDAHYSLDYQEESARHRVKEKGWALLKVRKDVGSGKSSEGRPGFQELLEDVGQHAVDVVVVYKLDRLSRNVGDIYQALSLMQDSGVEFVSLTEGFDTTTPMGRAMLGVAAVFAQLTRETIAENTKNGLLQRAKTGKYAAGPMNPYGYTYSAQTGMVPEPGEAAIVRRIFDLCLNDNLGMAKIARLLNREHVPTKLGQAWSSNMIARILKNPVVGGNIPHKGQVFAGTHEAIIDQETYQAAQERLGARKGTHHRTLTSRLLLLGVARCGRCGRSLRARYRDRKHPAYMCQGNQKIEGEGVCGGFEKAAPVLERVVADYIRAYAESEQMQRLALVEVEGLLHNELAPQRQERDRLLLELDDLASAFSKWADRLDRGLVDEEQFRQQNARLLERKRGVQERVRVLDESLARQERVHVEYETVRSALADFPRLWDAATLEEQQELVRLLVEKMAVTPDELQIKLKFGTSASIALARPTTTAKF